MTGKNNFNKVGKNIKKKKERNIKFFASQKDKAAPVAAVQPKEDHKE